MQNLMLKNEQRQAVMKKFIVALAAGAVVSACGGNPFTEDSSGSGSGTGTGTGTGSGTGTGITSGTDVPPGTSTPTPNDGIARSEPTSTESGKEGNGFARNIVYDPVNDEFSVDNLGFDGDNIYTRVTGTNFATNVSDYAIYEAAAQYPDSQTGNPVDQFTHRAIYGVSATTGNKFAIVRTGSYIPYGFGGFVYQREGGVTLPSTGQAVYTGRSQGIRDKNGAGGLQYTNADITIAIDFDDFDDTTGTRGDAVSGTISNRRIFDLDGNDITSTVVGSIRADLNLTAAQLPGIPDALFTVGPGNLDENGELLGEITSTYVNSNNQTQIFEEGNYYAIVSGANADEIVGVFVLETTVDPSADQVRDTSGFIAVR